MIWNRNEDDSKPDGRVSGTERKSIWNRKEEYPEQKGKMI
jgi:hypothetical protein